MHFIYSIIIGAISGFGASKLIKGEGLGLMWDIVLGVVGGFVGNYLFGLLGINLGSGVIQDLVSGVSGASLLLFASRLIKR